MTTHQDAQQSKVVVRPALESDARYCVDQLRDFSTFYGSKIPLFGDDAYFIDMFLNSIKNHVVYVAEKDGELLGFISGLLTPHLYNPEIMVLTETAWWVEPKHRGTRAGYLLFKAFKEFGEANCDWVIATLEAKSPVNEEFLIKQGFHFKEKSFVLEVN